MTSRKASLDRLPGRPVVSSKGRRDKPATAKQDDRRMKRAPDRLTDFRSSADSQEVRSLLEMCVGRPTPARIDGICESYELDPGARLIGLRRAGELAGCIGLRKSGRHEATIRHIAVLPSLRGQGIGRDLIDAAVTELGPTTVTAETDGEGVGFYRHCGFTVRSVGERYRGTERFACALAVAR